MTDILVMCHNDFAPYNCVFDGANAAGTIDFDTAGPGPRYRDLAYALYRFAPLAGGHDKQNPPSPRIHVARAHTFLNAYDADRSLRAAALVGRIPLAGNFVRPDALKMVALQLTPGRRECRPYRRCEVCLLPSDEGCHRCLERARPSDERRSRKASRPTSCAATRHRRSRSVHRCRRCAQPQVFIKG
jgi:hypothetical protein